MSGDEGNPLKYFYVRCWRLQDNVSNAILVSWLMSICFAWWSSSSSASALWASGSGSVIPWTTCTSPAENCDSLRGRRLFFEDRWLFLRGIVLLFLRNSLLLSGRYSDSIWLGEDRLFHEHEGAWFCYKSFAFMCVLHVAPTTTRMCYSDLRLSLFRLGNAETDLFWFSFSSRYTSICFKTNVLRSLSSRHTSICFHACTDTQWKLAQMTLMIHMLSLSISYRDTSISFWEIFSPKINCISITTGQAFFLFALPSYLRNDRPDLFRFCF